MSQQISEPLAGKASRPGSKWNLVFHIIAFGLFCAFIATGINVYGDYGVSWDGPMQRLVGGANLRFICDYSFLCQTDEFLRQFPHLLSSGDKDYGPVHEIVMMTAEWQLGITDSKEVYELRNLLNFSLFSVGLVAFYFFVTNVLGSPLYGILGVAIIALSPRFFAHAFFNTKDIAFVAGIMMSLYSMERFLKNPSMPWLLFHAFVTAITIDFRIMGIVIVCCTLTALYIKTLKTPDKSDDLKFSMKAYGFFTFLAVTIFFPYLWFNPIGHFWAALRAMAHFRWDQTVMYLGELVPATDLPWHYGPVWIAITTPLAYLGLIVLGSSITIGTILSRRLELWKNHEEMIASICLALFLGPLLMVILLGSVLYDGWRQLYFVYPPAIFLAVLGVKRLLSGLNNNVIIATAIALLLGAMLLDSANNIKSTHPFQQSYFNGLAGPSAKNRFELDYWGISNKQALEVILQDSPSGTIKVAGRYSAPMDRAVLSMPEVERDRVVVTKENADPDYIITNYRWDTAKDHSWYKGYDLLHQIKSGNTVVTTSFRKKAPKTKEAKTK